MERLAQGLVGVRDAWWRLPTAMPVVAGAEEGRRQRNSDQVLEYWPSDWRNGM
jgi:hypothetical protein